MFPCGVGAPRRPAAVTTERRLSPRAPLVVPEATLTFEIENHKESASAPLKAGSRVRIQYAPERLPSCRSGFNDGSPAWVITGYASLNGGEAPDRSSVAGHNARGGSVSELPVVDVPTGGDLAMVVPG